MSGAAIGDERAARRQVPHSPPGNREPHHYLPKSTNQPSRQLHRPTVAHPRRRHPLPRRTTIHAALSPHFEQDLRKEEDAATKPRNPAGRRQTETMPGATYYKTSQEWLDNSIDLIEAHPTTVRLPAPHRLQPLSHLPFPILKSHSLPPLPCPLPPGPPLLPPQDRELTNKRRA